MHRPVTFDRSACTFHRSKSEARRNPLEPNYSSAEDEARTLARAPVVKRRKHRTVAIRIFSLAARLWDLVALFAVTRQITHEKHASAVRDKG
jgi:hypothetical protein